MINYSLANVRKVDQPVGSDYFVNVYNFASLGPIYTRCIFLETLLHILKVQRTVFGSYPSYFWSAFTIINFLKSLKTTKSITTWFVSMVLYVYGKQLIQFIQIKTNTQTQGNSIGNSSQADQFKTNYKDKTKAGCSRQASK